MINKTTNTTFPLVERTNAAIVRKWHECVEEFCRSVGIDKSNAREVTLARYEHDQIGTKTETFIMRNGETIGKVTTDLKQTPAGLKFTITCQSIAINLPSPAEEKEATETP